MNEQSYEYWQENSQKFFFKWFLVLGGISVIVFGLTTGKHLVYQGTSLHTGALTLQLVRMSFTREFLPVNLGLTLAWLAPILGVFAYNMLTNSKLSGSDVKKVLIISRKKSLLFVAPILLVIGLVTGLLSAYSFAEHKIFSDLFDLIDYLESVIKCSLFVLILLYLSFLETTLVINIFNINKRIGVCFMFIFVGTVAILAMDYGISGIMVLLNL